jgi:hypothetical protein
MNYGSIVSRSIKDMIMIDTNTPQPTYNNTLVHYKYSRRKKAYDHRVNEIVYNELQRIQASDVQGEQSLSMVQAKVVDPRYEPQNGVYETEYNGFEIAHDCATLIRTVEEFK